MSLLVPIVVMKQFVGADGTPSTGSVTFTLTRNLLDPVDGETVPAVPVKALLDVTGVAAQQLWANDVTGLEPPNTQYQVVEEVSGGQRSYFVTVPHAPPGSRTVTDGAVTQGSALLSSATAAWTSADVGKYLAVPGVTPGVKVLRVTSGTAATMTTAATATGTGLSVVIGAEVSLTTLEPT